MVIDCCTQIFQIATGPSGPTAGFHILPASLRIHLSQHLPAEEIVQAGDPVGELGYFRPRGRSLVVSRFAMSVIDCQYIGDVDVFNVADATCGAVLRSDIPYEGVFGGPRRLTFAALSIVMATLVSTSSVRGKRFSISGQKSNLKRFSVSDPLATTSKGCSVEITDVQKDFRIRAEDGFGDQIRDVLPFRCCSSFF